MSLSLPVEAIARSTAQSKGLHKSFRNDTVIRLFSFWISLKKNGFLVFEICISSPAYLEINSCFLQKKPKEGGVDDYVYPNNL